MIKIKFIALIVFSSFIVSCSSNDDDSSQAKEPLPAVSFNLVYNNEVKKVDSWKAIKIGDLMEVTGQTSDGIGVDFKFNIYGNLYEGNSYGPSTLNSIPWYEVSQVFTSDTFIFTLENLDTTNKFVKVKFSGKLYDDAYDYKANYITNPSKFISISGSFIVNYLDVTPDIPEIGTFAKLDGKDWHGQSFYRIGSGVGAAEKIELVVKNDGEYVLGLVFLKEYLKTGTYSFTTKDSPNSVSFSKFDVVTHKFIDYNVSGTVIYTAINDYYVEGTFSLTATNPVDNSKIVITNGKFKEGR